VLSAGTLMKTTIASRPAAVEMAERGPDVVGTESSRQDQSVGDLSGQADGARTDPADQERWHNGRGPVQSDTVEVDITAVARHRLAPQQGMQGHGIFAQQRHRRGDLAADLAHPVGHAVADAGGQTSREQPAHRGELHGGQRDVAQRHGQQPDPDPDVTGRGQYRGGGGDAALTKAVLPHPQLGQPGYLGGRCDRAEPLRSLGGRKDSS
jgi:hypothetical protein